MTKDKEEKLDKLIRKHIKHSTGDISIFLKNDLTDKTSVIRCDNNPNAGKGNYCQSICFCTTALRIEMGRIIETEGHQYHPCEYLKNWILTNLTNEELLEYLI